MRCFRSDRILRIDNEKFRALTSSHVLSEDEKASSEPASPIKGGRESHTLMPRLVEPLTLRERTLPTPTVYSIELNLLPRISTFAVSDVPLLDIRKLMKVKEIIVIILDSVDGRLHDLRSTNSVDTENDDHLG
ncbi:hypothetical protein J6590_080865, partial [Homalodisca vitripennis]